MKQDFAISDHGSIVLLIPYSEEVEAWIGENIGDHLTFGRGVVIGHQYVLDIVATLEAEGFRRAGAAPLWSTLHA